MLHEKHMYLCTPVFVLWLCCSLEASLIATKLAAELFGFGFVVSFPRILLRCSPSVLTMEPKPGSQVGGGPYGLRRSLKVTENASPEARNNAQRRHNNPDYFDLPDPSQQALENENPFLMGIPDHTGPYAAASVEVDDSVLDDSLLDLDKDTLLSLTSDAVSQLSGYSGSSPISEPFSLAPSPISLTNRPQPQSPTPASVGAGNSNDYANDSDAEEDKENEAPLRGVPGRRTDAIRDLMDTAFVQVDDIFLQLATSTGQQVSALQNSWLSTHGITGTRTNWCKYEAYFAHYSEQERKRVGDPDATASTCYKTFKQLKGWTSILSTFDDLQDLDTGVTLRHRRRGFESVVKRLHKLCEELDRRNLDLYTVLVGNCVNEDGSLGEVVFTPGLENLMSKHLGLSDNELIAFAKTEAFNAVAAAASNDRAKLREDVASASKSTSTTGSSNHVASDGESVAIPGLPANANVDLLRNKCKAMLLRLFGMRRNPSHALLPLIPFSDEAGCSFAKRDGKGKAKASSDTAAPPSKSDTINLPYNSIPQHLAEHGFQLFNWPFHVDFPGYAGVEQKKGIKCLTAQTARTVLTLLHGVNGTKMFLKKSQDPDALIEHRLPVLFSCPPGLKNSESHGNVLFANGTLERCSTTHGLSKKSEVEVETQTSNATQPIRTSKDTQSTQTSTHRKKNLAKSASSSHPAPPAPQGPKTRSKGPHALVTVGSAEEEGSNPPTKATRRPHVADGSSDEEKTDSLRPPPPPAPQRPMTRGKAPLGVVAVGSSDDENSNPPTNATQRPFVANGSSDEEKPVHLRPLPRLKKKAATPTPVNSEAESLLPPRIPTAPTAAEASLMQREKRDAEQIFRELEERAKQAFPQTTTDARGSKHPLLDSFIPLLPSQPASKGFSSFSLSPAPRSVASLSEKGSTSTRGSTPSIAKRAGGVTTERVGSPPKKPRMSPVRELDEVLPDTHPSKAQTTSPPIAAPSQSQYSPPTLDTPQPTPTCAPEQPQAPPASTPGAWDPYQRDRMFFPSYGGGYFGGPHGYGPSMYEWPPHAPPPNPRSPPPSSGFPPQSYGGFSAPPYAYSPHPPAINPHYLHPAYGRPYDAPPPVIGSHSSGFNQHAYAGAGPGPFPPPNARDPSANSGRANGSAAAPQE
ncbi:hypothetical protein H0H93_011363 [Arthromyces matolae]|nr:hypothetical protein H0H93_011363 [Arthromyces matolae]